MTTRPSNWELGVLGVVMAVSGCGSSGRSSGAVTYHLDASGCEAGYVEITRGAEELSYEAADSGSGTGIAGSCPEAGFPIGGLPKYYRPFLGQSWTGSGTSNSYVVETTTTVESMTDTVSGPSGTFQNCARHVTVFSYPGGYTPGQPRWVRNEQWFAGGVGLVKYAITQDVATWNQTGELVAYDVSGASNSDYFPLAMGYSWSFKTTTGAGIATWTVTRVTQ